MILNKAYFGQYLHFHAKALKGYVTHIIMQPVSNQREKTADIWRRYYLFPRQMTSEKRAPKFMHTDHATLTVDLGSASDWLK